MRRLRVTLPILAAALLCAVLVAQEAVDLSVVQRIKSEAFDNSRVMDHVFRLADVYGPRLTGSPGFKAAAEWAAKQLQEWGCVNVKLEKWGPFGRSWSLVRYSGSFVEPQPAPIIGVVLPWTPGTNGRISGEAVYAPISMTNEQEFEKGIQEFKGKLRDKIVLMQAPPTIAMQTSPAARRLTDEELNRPFEPPVRRSPLDDLMPRPGRGGAGGPPPAGPPAGGRSLQARATQFMKDEGALMVLIPGGRPEWGVIVSGPGGSRDVKEPLPLPTVAIFAEQYNRMLRLIAQKIPVRLEFEIETKFYDEDLDSVNVIAEIPGARKRDEVVMLGAHLDSWTGGTGAADNAAGCAVMMEAMRILKALNLPLDRTVRIALWSAEEQGLLGSRAYVKEHFADPEDMKPKPEHAKLAAYFNLDNGSGKIRGVYLQGNEMVRPIFEAWLAPFREMGASTLSIRNTSGTDHLSFDAVGLPGFQFIQDPLEYGTRTHHADLDTYERVQMADLMQASAIVATFAYHAANRPELLPRKPMPKPKAAPKKQP